MLIYCLGLDGRKRTGYHARVSTRGDQRRPVKPRGRPRVDDRLEEVARGVVTGLPIVQVAESLSMTRSQVNSRLVEIRRRIVRETEEVRWLDATPVEIARKFLAMRGLSEDT